MSQVSFLNSVLMISSRVREKLSNLRKEYPKVKNSAQFIRKITKLIKEISSKNYVKKAYRKQAEAIVQELKNLKKKNYQQVDKSK